MEELADDILMWFFLLLFFLQKTELEIKSEALDREFFAQVSTSETHKQLFPQLPWSCPVQTGICMLQTVFRSTRFIQALS